MESHPPPDTGRSIPFQPQQIQGDTAALEFLVDIGVVRHLVDRLRGAGRKQTL